ncbi:hypothetical protein ALC57_08935 [Trachymyrmex cornetzi]|uniref:Uncharacterized protein n=1 Tax=Trachymyrmex cornetzi TaxID=471704 RepID=A0A151J697_9HYME|nr:hypothetical protein ALC57_08935 [Trachymyrmex cornetzi]
MPRKGGPWGATPGTPRQGADQAFGPLHGAASLTRCDRLTFGTALRREGWAGRRDVSRTGPPVSSGGGPRGRSDVFRGQGRGRTPMGGATRSGAPEIGGGRPPKPTVGIAPHPSVGSKGLEASVPDVILRGPEPYVGPPGELGAPSLGFSWGGVRVHPG